MTISGRNRRGRRGGTKDHHESIRIIHRALDAGMDLIDTVDVYSAVESEVIVVEARADRRRDEVFLATKFGFPLGDDPRKRGEVGPSVQRI